MRRGLLAAAQLLQRSRSAQACSELCAANGPALAAAVGWAGGSGSGSLRDALPWALHPQAALHTPAAALQPTRHSTIGSNSIRHSSKLGGSTSEVRHRAGSRPSPVPDVDAEQLLRSLRLSSGADPAVVLKRLRKLPGVRQQGVLDNAAAVVAHLRSQAVGLAAQQVGQLLERCPALFSWPPEQRAAVLFGQLLGAGLTAAEAARCFIAFHYAARCTTFAPSLAELATILAHSEDSSERGPVAKVPAAQRSVAALLSLSPGAVQLVCQRDGYLQRRAAELQQLGLTAAEVAAMAWGLPELLWTDAAARVASRAAVVQQELGLPVAEVVALAVKGKPSWLTVSITTVQERAAALAEGFGRAAAPGMLLKNYSVLDCDPAVWQRNLCYIAVCGVADPKAVLRHTPLLVHYNHAAAEFLQRRLLLQRAFGLTAAQLYEQHCYRLLYLAPTELAQRLHFVEHCGQAHRLVAKAARGRKPVAASAEERRPVLSLVAVTGTLEQFLAAVGASQAEWEAWAAANPPEACPLYGWAQQAAAEEAARLAAALPPELEQRERRRRSLRRRQQT